MDKSSSQYGLPDHYRFEIEKCVTRIKEKNAKRVALQFPEGLLLFATSIADILEEQTGAEMVIMGDVSYGACCVDDFSAHALGCDFMIHYGHSCLISVKDCLISNMMYVFVEIDIDVPHLVETVKSLVPKDTRLACIATVQFISAMRGAMKLLEQTHFEHSVLIPQNRPLSTGEILGCTSPSVWGASPSPNLAVPSSSPPSLSSSSSEVSTTRPTTTAVLGALSSTSASRASHLQCGAQHDGCEDNDDAPSGCQNGSSSSERRVLAPLSPESREEIPRTGITSPPLSSPSATSPSLLVDMVLYVGDGRFHLESFLIAHPGLSALQYDPYKKVLTKESYRTEEMRSMRREAVQAGCSAQSFAIIMGTLGRQGHPRVVDRIIHLAKSQGKSISLFLMSEIFPQKLALLQDVDCYIQVACPRLSIDWGYAFDKPLLSPYEAEVALQGSATWSDTLPYPMDHYSRAGGKWAVYTDKW